MDNQAFEQRNEKIIDEMSADKEILALSRQWMNSVIPHEYHYHFTWLGLPIIQFPSDILALQEIIWKVQPDLIVETGIARGGSLVFSASMLQLLQNDGRVVGIDIDIREHNRKAIEKHPMSARITMIEGSSTATSILQQVEALCEGKRTMVVLDSNHTHAHVLEELRAYSPFVSEGSYLIVFDTVIEDLPDELNSQRSWGKGDSPKTAVYEFLRENDQFEIDKEFENKLLITVAPDGFLRRK